MKRNIFIIIFLISIGFNIFQFINKETQSVYIYPTLDIGIVPKDGIIFGLKFDTSIMNSVFDIYDGYPDGEKNLMMKYLIASEGKQHDFPMGIKFEKYVHIRNTVKKMENG